MPKLDRYLFREFAQSTFAALVVLMIVSLGGVFADVLGDIARGRVPAGLMLFREFTVSALREVGAGKGIKLPVTMLAKWKTTLQLTALAAELLVASWGAFGLPPEPAIERPVTLFAHGLMWLATIVTLITGAQYWEQTRKALVGK